MSQNQPELFSDASKTREQLIRELAEMRTSQAKTDRLLSDVMDNMVAMIGLMTPAGVLIKANRTALEAASLMREDVLGKPFEKTFWWAWSSEVQNRLRAAIKRCAAGHASRYDEKIRVGENQFRTIDFMLAPMFDSDGRVVYMIPSATDITERKEAEENIRSIARFPEENPNPVMRVTVEGRLLYANNASRPLLEKWSTQVGKHLPGEMVEIIRDVVEKGVSSDLDVSCGPAIYLFSFTPVAEGPYVNLYGRDITARRQAEEALRKSELFHRQTLESIPGMVFTTRPDGYCDYQSQQWVDYTGVPMSEQLGNGWNDLLHPEDRFRAFAAWRAAVEENAPYDLEYRVRRHDGVYEWFRVIGKRIRDDEGLVIRWFGVAMNIEALKQAETTLRFSEAKYRSLFENLPVGVGIEDSQGRTLSLNPAGLKLHGFDSNEEMLSTLQEYANAFEISHLDGEKMPVEGWPASRALRGDFVKNYECRLRNRINGFERIVSYSVEPVRDSNGKVDLIVYLIQDMTERKEAEEALQEREKRFRELADSMPQLVWTANPDGKVVYYNERYKQYRGIEVMPDGAFRWSPVLHPDDHSSTVQAWRHAFETGDMYQVEHRVQTADGAYRWHLSRAIPVRDKTGTIIKWFGTATDIDDLRQAEAKLRQLNETLEQKVTERTQLAEQRARQLQALAVELVEAEERERRQIARLLHDDLQQMLAAANMQLQAASGRLSPGPILAKVGNILEQSIAKTRRLSHELSPPVLHHSGLIAGLEWLTTRMKDQFGLVVDFAASAEKQFENSRFKIFIFRAVQELLFNIVKHARVKSARIDLFVSDPNLVVTVSDQGKGFNPDKLRKMTVKAGLGLVSLRERANSIGGGLSVESAPGQGSRFILTLPCELDGDSENPDAEINSLAPYKRGDVDSGGLRLLFVDDHKVIRQGLIRLIGNQPDIMVVGEAATGRDAVNLVRQLKPDVVVMDVVMPEMDGVEATRRIKAEFPDLRVIGLSMSEDNQISSRMRQAGAEAFLSKTASKAELLKAIYGLHSE